MKIGIVSAILGDYSYEDMIDAIAQMGFRCVEVACWPIGRSERRYAGVCHIDVDRVLHDNDYCSGILSYAKDRQIEISSLAFYPNTMDGNLETRAANVSHLKNVIRASAKLNVNMVTTFIGRNQTQTLEKNLEEVKLVWPSIIQLAERLNVRVAIENCPMLFGPDQWPGGQNLFTSPSNWKKIFELIPSDYLGINYDPSHYVWQMMDYVSPVYQFRKKIFHVHFKDVKLYQDKLNEVGIMAYPLEFMSPKLPGLGDVQWDKFVSALIDIGYDGYACIEVEDRAFETSPEKILDSLRLSKRYLDNFVI